MPTTACPVCAVELTALKRGGWFCEDCNQRYDGALRPYQHRAEAQAAPRAVRATLPPPPDATTSALPFLLAHPLDASRAPGLSRGERASMLLWAGYQVVRTAGLLMLSDYLGSADECRKVNLALKALRVPDWWGWTVLCNQLVRFWSGELDEKPSAEPRLPKLVSGWRSFNRKNASKKESKWATLLDGLTGRDGAAHSANDALWHAYERLGQQGGEGEGPSQLTLERIDRLVEASAHRLFPKDSFSIVRRAGEPHAPAGVLLLHGAQPDGRFPVQPFPPALARGMGTVDSAVAVGSEAFSLYPLLLLFEPERRGVFLGGGMLEPLSLERVGSRTVGVLGAGGAYPKIFGPAIDVFREKKVDMLARESEISVASVAPWAAVMLGNVLRQLRGSLPEHHVERPGIDDALEATLQNPGRAVLIVGPAGAGKTSLMARLAVRATRVSHGAALDEQGEPITSARRGGDIAILLSGRGAYSMAMERSGNEMLADAVARKIGVREKRFKTLADLCAALDEGGMRGEGRRLWLLLDGLDEAEQAPALLRAVDQFLPTAARYSWLRLCVSVDESTLRASSTPHLLENHRFLAQFYRRNSHTLAPYLICRPFSLHEELPAAYAHHLGAGAPLPPLEGVGRELLASPLHLRLFVAAHSLGSREIPLSEDALFAAYFARLASAAPRISEAIERFGEAMLAHRSVDLLAAAVDKSRRTAGAPPFTELVDAGLLLPPCDDGGDGEEAYVPASPAFTREILLASLRRRHAGAWPDREGLAAWAREALGRSRKLDLSSPFVASLTLALETAVARMVRDGKGDEVASLLRFESEEMRSRLLSAALVAVGRGGREEERAAAALFSAASSPEDRASLIQIAVSVRRLLSTWGQPAAAASVERLHLRLLRAQLPHDAASLEAQGRSMVELTLLLAQAGQTEHARRYAAEAARVLRSLAPSASSSLLLGSALRLSGSLTPAERRGRDGAPLLREALNVLRVSEASDPSGLEIQAEIAATLAALAELAEAAGARPEAHHHLSALALTRRRLAAADPLRLDWQNDLGRTLTQLAELEIAAGSHAEARKLLDESVSALRALVAREPRWHEAQLDLWRALGSLGNLARTQGQRDEGLRLLEETIEGLRSLHTRGPDRDAAAFDLAVALTRTGALLIMEGKRSRARKLLEESISLLREHWHHTGSIHSASELASALSSLGNLARVEGKQTEGRQHFHEATELCEAIVEREPRLDSLAQLAQSLWSSSLVETDASLRRRFLDRLKTTLARSQQAAPLAPALVRLSEMCDRAIAAL